MSEDSKQRAAEAALLHVRDGMTIGLGTGSTMSHAIRGLASILAKEGWRIRAVPTSHETERLATSLGIPLTTLEEVDVVDLAIDGADEVDPKLNLIKGAGGALFREKVVARAASKVVIVVDESKIVDVLGTRAPVPVEVHPFGWRITKRLVEGLWCRAVLRASEGVVFHTDNGNLVLDCRFGPIPKPEKLEREINNIPGVLENGLFVGLAPTVVVGGPSGVRTLPA